MKFSKGDKIKQVKAIKGFNHIGKEFIITRIDHVNHCVEVRFDGEVKDFFPELGLISNGVFFSKELKFNFSIELFDTYDYFKKVHTWSDWRKPPVNNYWDEKLNKYIIDKNNPPMYRTNRKYVIFKCNGLQARASCNEDDTFNLYYGLDLAIQRWIEKVEKPLVCATQNKAITTESNVDFIEKNCDLFDMPCYYHLAQCISTDYNLCGYTARKFNELCNLKKAYEEVNSLIPYDVGEVFYWGNVFNLVTNAPYKKMTFEALNDCVMEMAETCLSEKVGYLAIPHFGSRKNNLKWEEVKDMVLTVFRSVYDDTTKNTDNISIQIVACDNSNILYFQDASIENVTTNVTYDSIENEKLRNKEEKVCKFDWTF